MHVYGICSIVDTQDEEINTSCMLKQSVSTSAIAICGGRFRDAPARYNALHAGAVVLLPLWLWLHAKEESMRLQTMSVLFYF